MHRQHAFRAILSHAGQQNPHRFTAYMLSN
ncbi:Uncharacterised protein [Vibrio cholerae]|nr:Uncharacterised protein [Vibrio cholerae]